MVRLCSACLFLFILANPLPDVTQSSEEETAAPPGVNERLDQAIGSEGGVQVYQDPDGNVGTVIDPPGGERQSNVQPPQSPSMNLGPPLQLHQPPLKVPPITPPGPPAPDLPQKAH